MTDCFSKLIKMTTKTMSNNPIKTFNRQSGLSLVEILITVLIMSIGALGIASMQLTGLKYSTGAYGRTQATLLANDMMDRIRANKDYARTGGQKYKLSSFVDNAPTSQDCNQNPCSPADLAEFDTSVWLQNVSRLLTSGKARINITTSGSSPVETFAEISLQWRQSATGDTDATTANDIDAAELRIITFKSSI